MDRRQMIVQRAREFFGDRLDDVVHMVRQDRQELRGWQEPAHVRAVVRRTIREQTGTETTTTTTTTTTRTALTPTEFGRNAGEPDRGQQPEFLSRVSTFLVGLIGPPDKERRQRP